MSEIDYWKKQIGDLYADNTMLKYKNRVLLKKNEQLENRLDLLENRPVPRHFDPKIDTCEFGKHFFELDMYTLENIWYLAREFVEKMKGESSITPDNITGCNIIIEWLWDKLSEDSKQWIATDFNKKMYYGDDE